MVFSRLWWIRTMGALGLLLIVCASLPGRTPVSFAYGTITQFQADPFSQDTCWATWVDVGNYQAGSEARLRLASLELDATVFLRQGDIIDVTPEGLPVFADDVANHLSGIIAAGFSTEVASYTRMGFLVGAFWGIDIKTPNSVVCWLGDGSNVSGPDPEEWMRRAKIAYRWRMDLELGSWTIGIDYQVPSSDWTLAVPSFQALQPLWNEGRLGFVLLSRLF
jgi:hypothetical protein